MANMTKSIETPLAYSAETNDAVGGAIPSAHQCSRHNTCE